MSWLENGWQVFGAAPDVSAWVEDVRGPALAATRDPARRATWLRHGGTWFVGVDALGNDEAGRVGAAYRAASEVTAVTQLHPAQISITFPGYPLRDADESEAAHRFRRRRDAAHLDGLLPEGPEKRRHLREPHAWILGIALTEADAGAAPLIVWEGSHRVVRAAFEQAFRGIAPEVWGDVDVTEIYQAARARVFESCPRREVPLQVGETVLLHRMVIHGVAPWADGAEADPEGRAIAYFRPCFGDPADWLSLP